MEPPKVEEEEMKEEEAPPPVLPRNNNNSDEEHSYNFLERSSMRMARYPRTHFWVSFLLALVLSIIGIVVGDFSVAADNDGWTSRGTMIANRQTQVMMVMLNRYYLFANYGYWDHLETNTQSGWEGDDDSIYRRALEEEKEEEDENNPKQATSFLKPQQGDEFELARRAPSDLQLQIFQKLLHRHLSEVEEEPQETSPQLQYHYPLSLAQCDFNFYTDGNMTYWNRLWPVWKVKDKNTSALDPQVLEDLCVSEGETQRILRENGHCFGCPDEQCLPPYSLVFFTRLLIEGGMQLDCKTLAQRYTELDLQPITEEVFQACVVALAASTEDSRELPEECPEGFYPSLLDEFFQESGLIQYTSSIFATRPEYWTIDAMYEDVSDYDKGTKNIEGVYDTQYEDFAQMLTDDSIQSDMVLATGSAIITTLAMLLHTRSFFLSLVGILQIILTFPLAYFTYRFLGQLTFFPFLNFIGIFVVFALGADHVFVAVDKWKNARKDFPTLSTPQIAAKALPDAAEAMLLTTTTTAIAFFGTAICPVAPVRMFAIFCGLLITWDYILDVLLIFPSLCIYDEYREKPNCFCTCHCCAQCEGGRNEIDDDEDVVVGDEDGNVSDGKHGADSAEGATKSTDADGNAIVTDNTLHLLRNRYKDVDDDHKPSLIRRILLGYYHILHTMRWPLLLGCAASFAICVYFASTIELPTSSDVRLLPADHEFEKAYSWRLNLLNEVMMKQSGSSAYTIWGVTPADTGNHNDPSSWSTLVLDDTFDPSTPDAQVYLRDFCGIFFDQEFASPINPYFECPINVFDQWLQAQSNENMTTKDEIYTRDCGESGGLPINDPNTFHACLTSWSQQEGEYSILSRDGIVEIMYFPFASRKRYDSPNDELDKEWHLTEKWFEEFQGSTAPNGVKKAFFSSHDYWWYDTNSQMLSTAKGGAAIAISASAVIILLSSRSLIMTLYSVISVAYVLGSVTAMMVASNWRLGFLESICFAILIGISVDFVIHFSHAYTSLPGTVSKERRTKHALIYMGPSILAAAVTTLAGALIMLFCVIVFFTKFATILFFTIVQSLVGSFVVFLTLTDCIGPTAPTYWADELVEKLKGNSPASDDENRISQDVQIEKSKAKDEINHSQHKDGELQA